jgi:protein SCO1
VSPTLGVVSVCFVFNIQKLEKEMESRSVGRAQVGGPFEMTTHHGKPFTEKDLLGKWSLIYFGFTNCPDICPEELDKMSAAVTELGT